MLQTVSECLQQCKAGIIPYFYVLIDVFSQSSYNFKSFFNWYHDFCDPGWVGDWVGLIILEGNEGNIQNVMLDGLF